MELVLNAPTYEIVNNDTIYRKLIILVMCYSCGWGVINYHHGERKYGTTLGLNWNTQEQYFCALFCAYLYLSRVSMDVVVGVLLANQVLVLGLGLVVGGDTGSELVLVGLVRGGADSKCTSLRLYNSFLHFLDRHDRLRVLYGGAQGAGHQ